MATVRSHGSFVVDVTDLKKLAADLKRGAPLVAKSASKRLKVAAQIVADEARARSSGLAGVPQTIKPSVTGVLTAKVVAGRGEQAPHLGKAAAFENQGNEGTFRHPVFGDKTKWAEQQARPFLAPALDAKIDELTEAVAEVIDDVLHEIGYNE